MRPKKTILISTPRPNRDPIKDRFFNPNFGEPINIAEWMKHLDLSKGEFINHGSCDIAIPKVANTGMTALLNQINKSTTKGG